VAQGGHVRSERRAMKRFKISYYLPINRAGTMEKLGILTEINTRGLQVDSQALLSVGKSYKLNLDLMNSALGASQIEFTATVRWINPDPIEPNFYNIGFQIDNLSSTARDVIEKIMARYGSGNFS